MAKASDKKVLDKKVNVAIIGLGFGAEFIPIYKAHPNANMYAICQRNEERMNKALYGNGEKNALYRLKNRLLESIGKSIAVQYFDQHEANVVMNGRAADMPREVGS